MQFTQVTYTLSNLIGQIEVGSIGLPELQRPFVWNNTKIRDLFDSMYRGFPVGFLLFWQNDVEPGAKQIGTDTKQKVPSSLVVDGQQRLTSLYAVMKGTEVIGSDYQSQKIRIAFRPIDGKFEVTAAPHTRDPEWIPNISEVWNDDVGLLNFAASFVDRLKNTRDVSTQEENQIGQAIQKLHGIRTFQFTALELASQLDEEQVAEIFVRINSEGVRLSQADFILTLMSVWWEKGRKEIEEFCRAAQKPSKSGGSPFNWYIEPSPDQLVRVSIALGFRRARLSLVYGILRGKDLETKVVTPELREQQFERLREAQEFALDVTNWHEFFKAVRAAGYQSSKMITSQTALIYTYAMFLIGRKDFGVDWERLRAVIARWFFMVTITSRYSASSETQMELDMSRLRSLSTADEFVKELDRICESELTADYWEIRLPNDLDRSGTRNPALFAFDATLCLLNATALFSNLQVSALLDPSVKAKKAGVERHHLFPRSYLDSIGFKTVPQRNQLANYALVEWHDNIEIGAKPPSDYFAEYAERFDPVELDQMLQWHALADGWAEQPYQTFLENRRYQIAQVIKSGWESLGMVVQESPQPVEQESHVSEHWSLEELIERSESNRVEFKSSARWNYDRGDRGREIEDAIVKTVAGFMNSQGGTLIVGVDDDGNILGLAKDLSTVGGKNLDGLDLFLHRLLDDAVGVSEVANLVSISFVEVADEDLCRVDVRASNRPIYAKTSKDDDTFFIRSGASTKKLGTRDAHTYINDHWKQGGHVSSGTVPSPNRGSDGDLYVRVGDDSPAAGKAESDEEWSAAEIRRCFRESPPALVTVMRQLAENPDKPFLADVLAESIGYTSHQFAGAMGAFGRRVKSRYEKTSWPFSARWSEFHGMMEYRMDAETADIVLGEEPLD